MLASMNVTLEQKIHIESQHQPVTETKPLSVSCLWHTHFNSSRPSIGFCPKCARPQKFTEASGLKRHAARHARAFENYVITLPKGAESRRATQRLQGRVETQRFTQRSPGTIRIRKGFWKHTGTSTVLFVDSLRCVLERRTSPPRQTFPKF